MHPQRHYRIAQMARQFCSLLEISPARVLERAGLRADLLESEGKGVDAAGFFAMWRAAAEEHGGADVPLLLGRGAARGPMQPALLAFAASPDIRTGLQRLALFKPLCAPLKLTLEEAGGRFSIAAAPEEGQEMPAVMAATEIVFFLDFARTFAAHPIRPVGVALPDPSCVTPGWLDYVGVAPVRGPAPALILSSEDAGRALISADTEFYALMERELLSRLAEGECGGALCGAARRAVTELLPSGEVSAEAVARRLGLSKRTLQRRLKEEGTGFQALLDEVREQLALSYLRDRDLSAEEISFLLAFRDPNSFYRAFHAWTGMTPAEARARGGRIAVPA